MSEYVRNTSPFATTVDGRPRVVKFGDVIAVDDPVYRGREHRFESMDEYIEREKASKSVGPRVERATAAPGETREVHIPVAGEVVEPERPTDDAPRSEWLEYARMRGYDGSGRVSKDELITQFG